MWAMAMITVMASLIGLQQLYNEIMLPSDVVKITATSQANNMVVYKNAVDAYVATKPAGYTETAAGNTVADASLTLPSWFIRNQLWTNKVIAGKVTVYATVKPDLGDISGQLARITKGSRFAGVVSTSTNTILSPIYGDTGIALPPGLPDGVPVMHSRIN